MTPEEARDLLAWPEDKDHPKVRDGSGRTWFEVQAGESHPYWNRLPDAPYEDAVMYAAAQDALATIAGMREEWGVSYRWANDDAARIEWGNDTRDEAVKWARKLENYPGSRAYVYGPVRRYVTPEEEIS